MDLKERFWAKVKREDGCWEWTAHIDDWGYGVFRVNRKLCKAHRVSWEWENGPIPDGSLVLHRCDNPKCVRPDHLFLGTPKDNMRDASAKGRLIQQKDPSKQPRGERHGSKTRPEKWYAGEKHGMAVLTNAQVEEIRQRYVPRKVSAYKLAKEYGVSRSVIQRAVTGESYKDAGGNTLDW